MKEINLRFYKQNESDWKKNRSNKFGYTVFNELRNNKSAYPIKAKLFSPRRFVLVLCDSYYNDIKTKIDIALKSDAISSKKKYLKKILDPNIRTNYPSKIYLVKMTF